jgi:molybdate transport system ATP-binding protein
MIEGAVGAQVWLRVRARDVAIARDVMPSSASNQLRGTVLQVMDRDEAFTAVELGLSAAAPAGQRIWALITRRSAAHLGITIGTPWIASFKAVCVEGRAISVRQ